MLLFVVDGSNSDVDVDDDDYMYPVRFYKNYNKYEKFNWCAWKWVDKLSYRPATFNCIECRVMYLYSTRTHILV